MIRIPRDLAGKIKQAIQRAQEAGALPVDIPEPSVARPRQADHGDYATPVAMQLARLARMKPDDIAQAIIDHFPEADYIGSIERVGGFINFRLADRWLQQQVDAILAAGDSYAQFDDFAGKRAQVECVSANPTGPITVGRVRGGVMGDTLARLLRAVGYDVEMELFQQRRAAMRLLGERRARYRERLGLEAEFPADGYRGEYIYDIADELIAERATNWRTPVGRCSRRPPRPASSR